ncbi:hypothetical protein RM531_08520 [Salinisphaera sp. P385]|uniref:Sel1 repeat-containing protein n=1 Tax=Spectribacter acetivorans TaxID=3075603 RepID=A0ABU3B7R8_9GAMM|nr:hypothetical protein [Salinisphaera sp. P385]MDT0618520.1 hypothetical protein [Salinisphaera sp. P385]
MLKQSDSGIVFYRRRLISPAVFVSMAMVILLLTMITIGYDAAQGISGGDHLTASQRSISRMKDLQRAGNALLGNQEDPEDLVRHGRHLLNSRQDYDGAVRAFEKAALQGYGAAMLALGETYLGGGWSAQDPVEGYAWLTVAEAMKVENASAIRRDLTSDLSYEDMKDGQSRAGEIVTEIQQRARQSQQRK